MTFTHQQIQIVRSLLRKQDRFLSEFNKYLQTLVKNPPSTEFLEALLQYLQTWGDAVRLELLSRRTTSSDF